MSGDGGHVAVRRCAFEIRDTLVATVDIRSGASRHHVGVDIDRVDRVGNREPDVSGENLLDVAAVALGSVGHENLVRLNPTAARGIVMLRDRLAEKGIALLGTVALEALPPGHLIGRRVQRLDANRRKRFGDVANAEPDDRL